MDEHLLDYMLVLMDGGRVLGKVLQSDRTLPQRHDLVEVHVDDARGDAQLAGRYRVREILRDSRNKRRVPFLYAVLEPAAAVALTPAVSAMPAKSRRSNGAATLGAIDGGHDSSDAMARITHGCEALAAELGALSDTTARALHSMTPPIDPVLEALPERLYKASRTARRLSMSEQFAPPSRGRPRRRTPKHK